MAIFLINLFDHQCPTDTIEKKNIDFLNLIEYITFGLWRSDRDRGKAHSCWNYNSQFSSVVRKNDYHLNTKPFMARF